MPAAAGQQPVMHLPQLKQPAQQPIYAPAAEQPVQQPYYATGGGTACATAVLRPAPEQAGGQVIARAEEQQSTFAHSLHTRLSNLSAASRSGITAQQPQPVEQQPVV